MFFEVHERVGGAAPVPKWRIVLLVQQRIAALACFEVQARRVVEYGGAVRLLMQEEAGSALVEVAECVGVGVEKAFGA
jgi:hypothetical protein